jgi:LPXTG-motif cell wall-anchored protein
MRKNLAAFLAVSALAFAGAAAAQTTTDSSASGVVVSVTTDSFVVRMDDGTQRTFVTDTTTTLPSARLAEGNRVTVNYRALDAGRWQATTVALVDRAVAELSTPSERPADRAAPQPEPLTRDTTSPDRNRETLPDTASNMPLLPLFGGAALAGALALTLLRRSA